MSQQQHFLALDFGAESGRGELVTLSNGKVSMTEMHRFPNRAVRLNGTLYWDFPYLFAEILNAIRACEHEGIELTSIGVDTWGVDFGLLDKNGQLLGNPVHYRDDRTEGMPEYAAETMPLEKIFELTGCQPWRISSLLQLLAMKKAGHPALDVADTFLMMSDLFNFFLTGRKACEVTQSCAGNLLDVDCNWSRDIMDAFELPADMFPKTIEPGQRLGDISRDVAENAGIRSVPVLTACGHDTAAAVSALPHQGRDCAFLSCGTWSILGLLTDKPIVTEACYRDGFTSERTFQGWYLCKNMLGLWLIQQLRAVWDSPSDQWSYPRITDEAAKSASGNWDGLVNVQDDSLLAPQNMEEALTDLLKKSGQGQPPSHGDLARCVLESLALEYSVTLERMIEHYEHRPQMLYIVGGGVANKLLCQYAADACGIEVNAGMDQCTALGNALVQARGMGVLKDDRQVREVVRGSFDFDRYRPQNPDLWAKKKQQYLKLKDV